MKAKCEVTFYWDEEFDEEDYYQLNDGATEVDAWGALRHFIDEERVGRLEGRADNCLPSDYHMSLSYELED